MEHALEGSGSSEGSPSSASAVGRATGNAPRRWQDYLTYPRVFLVGILCIISTILHVAFGVYVLFFEK